MLQAEEDDLRVSTHENGNAIVTAYVALKMELFFTAITPTLVSAFVIVVSKFRDYPQHMRSVQQPFLNRSSTFE